MTPWKVLQLKILLSLLLGSIAQTNFSINQESVIPNAGMYRPASL
jgi:hypothetical protein